MVHSQCHRIIGLFFLLEGYFTFKLDKIITDKINKGQGPLIQTSHLAAGIVSPARKFSNCVLEREQVSSFPDMMSCQPLPHLETKGSCREQADSRDAPISETLLPDSGSWRDRTRSVPDKGGRACTLTQDLVSIRQHPVVTGECLKRYMAEADCHRFNRFKALPCTCVNMKCLEGSSF